MLHRILTTCFFLLVFLTQGKASEENELYLVIGSNRTHPLSLGYLRDQLQDNKNVNLTHNTTYDSKATTIDLHATTPEFSTHHIQEDILKYLETLSSPKIIKAAYLERLPTVNDKDEDIIQKVVQALAPKMSDGATLEIEWDPYVGRYTSRNHTEELEMKNLATQNIFTGYFHTEEIFTSFSIYAQVYPKSEDFSLVASIVPEAIVNHAKTIRDLVKFYSKETGIAEKTIREALIMDMSIFLNMVKHDSFVIMNKTYPGDNLDNFISQVKNNDVKYAKDHQLNHVLDLQKQGLFLQGQIFDRLKYWQNALFTLFLSDMTVLANKEKALEQIRKCGFDNVTLERTISPHNGRKHVWILKGTKKSSL